MSDNNRTCLGLAIKREENISGTMLLRFATSRLTKHRDRNNYESTSALIDYIYTPTSVAIRHRKSSATHSLLLRPAPPPLYLWKATGEKRPCAAKLEEAKFLAGMEMAVDFDLTPRNLITTRIGPNGSKIRNEASRRSRVNDECWSFVTNSIGELSPRATSRYVLSIVHIPRRGNWKKSPFLLGAVLCLRRWRHAEPDLRCSRRRLA